MSSIEKFKQRQISFQKTEEVNEADIEKLEKDLNELDKKSNTYLEEIKVKEAAECQREMENISIHVASGKVDNFLLKDIIQSIIYEDDFSEELKLQLIDAII